MHVANWLKILSEAETKFDYIERNNFAFASESVGNTVKALEACVKELNRLREVHLPRYEDRIGEPDHTSY